MSWKTIVVLGVVIWLLLPKGSASGRKSAGRWHVQVVGEQCRVRGAPGIGDTPCTGLAVVLRGLGASAGDIVEVDPRQGTSASATAVLAELDDAGFVVEEVAD